MKYLIDYRFRKLQAITFQTSSFLSICQNGHSYDLGIVLRNLQTEIQGLKTLKSPPFTPEQIARVEEIEQRGMALLLLPDDYEEAGKELLEVSERLMTEIDPFVLAYPDSLSLRKAHFIELSKEVQHYAHAHLLAMEGKASPLVDSQIALRNIFQNVKNIEKDGLSDKEKEVYDRLFDAYLQHESEVTPLTARVMTQVASEAEHIFGHEEAPYKTLWELSQFLLKIAQESTSSMSSEREGFVQFATPLRKEVVHQGIHRLKHLKLNAKPLINARDNLIFAYENGAQEDGETLISRCRAIDFYKLFYYELREFVLLLNDRPDRDLKLF